MSRFGVIPKDAPGEWRLILDLSSPPGFSVNDGISADDSSVRYQGIDQAIDAILSVGKGALLSKFDIERAYRNVPIHPEDRFLLGMKWDGHYYVDLTLPFGGRPSATIFSSVADVLQFILSSVALRSVLLHYLDDFLNVFDPRSRFTASAYRAANVDLDTELSTCEIIYVRLTTCLTFLGT